MKAQVFCNLPARCLLVPFVSHFYNKLYCSMLNTTLMVKSKYTVTLTDDQRSFLESFIRRGKSSASTIRHVYILLHADKPDPEVAEIVRCHPSPCSTSAKRFSRGASTRRCTRNFATNPRVLGKWTVPAKPGSSRSPAANHLKVGPTKRYSCLPLASWN